ncbi:MAG: glycosyltransferase [Clostridiales bacterium]|nr:glycosyltransferase [Clostridiales bacterium]
MKVDVIIPTYKPNDTFCLLLQKLQEQTFLIHRVLILNTEETLWKKAVETYPIEECLNALSCSYSVYHLGKEEFDHGGTRLFGAGQSEADVLLFMTQDAVPADEFLVEQLVKGLTDENTAVAYARQLPREDCSIVERYTRQFNYPDMSRKKGKEDIPVLGIKTFFCSDVCAAYRRSLFEKLGGFETPVIFNEDMFFAAKAVREGYYVYYAAEAKVIHSHNYSIGQQFHRNFDLAVSQKQHPEIFRQISSEAEGMKLVKSTVKYLCSIGKLYLIFQLGMQCVGKYTGYLMGKHYEKLSRKQILRYTMNRDYWVKLWKEADNQRHEI